MASRAVAIVGAGVTPVVRHADRPVGALAVEASRAALADAGLTAADVDGITCGVSLPVWGGAGPLRMGVDGVDSAFLARQLGIEPAWSLDGTNLPPTFAHATSAVAAGAAECVLVNRTLHNPPSGYNAHRGTTAAGPLQWMAPYGNSAPIIGFALVYHEYQQRYGARREDMAAVVAEVRRQVLGRPEPYWGATPLTAEDYLASRMISDPMGLYDSDLPVDGSASFVVTTAARAAALPHRPVFVVDWSLRAVPTPRPPGTFGTLAEHQSAGAALGRRVWDRTGLRPRDIDVLEVYDGFTPLIYLWLEALGACGEGEAWQALADGGLRSPATGQPMLTGGGSTGWGRVHGIAQLLECYLQLAGRAGERQRSAAASALMTYALPRDPPASVLVFATEPP